MAQTATLPPELEPAHVDATVRALVVRIRARREGRKIREGRGKRGDLIAAENDVDALLDLVKGVAA